MVSAGLPSRVAPVRAHTPSSGRRDVSMKSSLAKSSAAYRLERELLSRYMVGACLSNLLASHGQYGGPCVDVNTTKLCNPWRYPTRLNMRVGTSVNSKRTGMIPELPGHLEKMPEPPEDTDMIPELLKTLE